MTAIPTDQDRRLLRRAAELSALSLDSDVGGPFGAVVATAGGVIVAEGWNEVLATSDPTAHAEVTAIRKASEALGTHVLAGHVMYASCEPCPMCLSAVLWARMDRVVFANGREDAARIGFDDARIYGEVASPPAARSLVCTQVASPEAAAVFDAWCARPDKTIY